MAEIVTESHHFDKTLNRLLWENMISLLRRHHSQPTFSAAFRQVIEDIHIYICILNLQKVDA